MAAGVAGFLDRVIGGKRGLADSGGGVQVPAVFRAISRPRFFPMFFAGGHGIGLGYLAQELAGGDGPLGGGPFQFAATTQHFTRIGQDIYA